MRPCATRDASLASKRRSATAAKCALSRGRMAPWLSVGSVWEGRGCKSPTEAGPTRVLDLSPVANNSPASPPNWTNDLTPFNRSPCVLTPYVSSWAPRTATRDVAEHASQHRYASRGSGCRTRCDSPSPGHRTLCCVPALGMPCLATARTPACSVAQASSSRMRAAAPAMSLFGIPPPPPAGYRTMCDIPPDCAGRVSNR